MSVPGSCTSAADSISVMHSPWIVTAAARALGRRRPRPARRRGELLLFACLLVLYLWPIDRIPGVNVYAHLDQAASVVADGSLTIDRFVSRSRTNTIDWAKGPDGHFYPAKAPGAALYAIPVFYVLYHVERGMGLSPVAEPLFRKNAVLVNWLLNALVSAAAVGLLVRLGESVGLTAGASLAGALAIALGTGYYPYATVYYSHVPAANAIIVAALFIFREQPRRNTDAAAGLLAGIAVLFDYPAAIAVVAMSAALFYTRPRSLVAFACGGLLPLAVMAAYHTVAFGTPLATPYFFQNPEFASDEGTFLSGPSGRVLRELLVGRYRGLCVFSPVLIFALYGGWASILGSARVDSRRAKTLRVYAVTAVSVLVLWLLLNASYRVWWGGYTSGPRLIIPALALLAPLIGLGVQRFPRAGFTLLTISAVNQLAITGVWVRLSEDYSDPLRQVIYPLLLAGQFDRSNIGIAVGMTPRISLVVPGIAAAILLTMSWRRLRQAPDECSVDSAVLPLPGQGRAST